MPVAISACLLLIPCNWCCLHKKSDWPTFNNEHFPFSIYFQYCIPLRIYFTTVPLFFSQNLLHIYPLKPCCQSLFLPSLITDLLSNSVYMPTDSLLSEDHTDPFWLPKALLQLSEPILKPKSLLSFSRLKGNRVNVTKSQPPYSKTAKSLSFLLLPRSSTCFINRRVSYMGFKSSVTKPLFKNRPLSRKCSHSVLYLLFLTKLSESVVLSCLTSISILQTFSIQTNLCLHHSTETVPTSLCCKLGMFSTTLISVSLVHLCRFWYHRSWYPW